MHLVAKVGLPLGLGLFFAMDFFDLIKKEKINTKIKMHWRLGRSDLGEISEPGTKRRPLRQVQRLLLEKNGLCILILPYLN